MPIYESVTIDFEARVFNKYFVIIKFSMSDWRTLFYCNVLKHETYEITWNRATVWSFNVEELLLHLRPPLLPDDAGDEGGDEEDEEDGGEDHDDADADAGAVLQPAREPTSGQGEMC